MAAACALLLLLPSATYLLASFVENPREMRAVWKAARNRFGVRATAHAAWRALGDAVATPAALARSVRDARQGFGADGAAARAASRLASAALADALAFPSAFHVAATGGLAHVRAVAAKHPLTFALRAALDAVDDITRLPDVLVGQTEALLRCSGSRELAALFLDVAVGPPSPSLPSVKQLHHFVDAEAGVTPPLRPSV